MLNKIKKLIVPMMETLRDAAQYLFALDESQSGGILADITEFLNAINGALGSEYELVKRESATLIEALPRHGAEEGKSRVSACMDAYREAVNRIPVRYKAVFLPYYENTWDSLESVYEAFAADPLFETEIVIIPIRRNTPTGVKYVYEDYLTPKDVLNTHYQEYDFEEDQPDFVFYNNPYDGVNYPKFQSSNIRNHAGCMIYVPYHLYRHNYVMPEKFARSLSEHTQLPGHDNCDVFVVQGESFYRRYAGKSRNGGKMVTLGNPKTDFLQSRKASGDWPRFPKWEEKFGGKSVFMLNTHYSVFALEATADRIWIPMMLEMLQNRTDAAFIWRPHPQTFIMLNGEPEGSESFTFFKRCMDIVNSGGNIIMDRTPSATSALLYSRGLISQHSSIVSEAQALNLPVMLLGPDARQIEWSLKYKNILGFYESRDVERLEKELSATGTPELFFSQANETLTITRETADKLLELLREGARVNEDPRLFEVEYVEKAEKFIDAVSNGADSKAEVRKKYVGRLLTNNGCCAPAILSHIKENWTREPA